MVTLIILVTVICHLLDFLTNERYFYRYLRLGPAAYLNPVEWVQFVSYGLVHSPHKITHVIFNMLSLYLLGREVEDRLGRYEFLRFYVLAILVGGLFSNLWCSITQPHSVVGASGGVQAVCMLYVFFAPQSTLFIFGLVPTKAWVMGILMVVFNLLGVQEGTAVEVHLAGIAFAAIYYFYGLRFHWLSLDGWQQLLRRKRRQQTRSKLRVHVPPKEEPDLTDDEAEADRLLDKIHKKGEASLTAAEREILERYSRKIRERRLRE
jgi:membrane associated rhomboid family serine protease